MLSSTFDLETTSLPVEVVVPRIRSKANRLLTKLRQRLEADTDTAAASSSSSSSSPPLSSSWIRGNTDTNGGGGNDDDEQPNSSGSNDLKSSSSEFHIIQSRTMDCHHLDTYGFVVIPNFSTSQQVSQLKKSMFDLVERQWHPNDVGSVGSDDDDNKAKAAKEIKSFGTDAESNTARGDYFLDSSNRVHYFAEKDAIDSETHQLKAEFLDEPGHKWNALNKAGHGLHLPSHMLLASVSALEEESGKTNNNSNNTNNNPFYEYTTSTKMRDLIKSFGWIDPVIPQSMYIFKQPNVGGTVHSHQDSTFLFTNPKQSCLGLWLALDDATLHNGCLWVRPYSHLERVRRQFIRNPVYFGNDKNGSDNNGKEDRDGDGDQEQQQQQQPSSPSSVPKLTFRQLHEEPNVTWEGKLPPLSHMLGVLDDDDDDDISSMTTEQQHLQHLFIPVECNAGDLVVFVGTLDHFSLPNLSTHARHTFQLHLVEGPRAGVTWSPENWLQYPPPKQTSTRSSKKKKNMMMMNKKKEEVMEEEEEDEDEQGDDGHQHPEFLRLFE
jgi:ectoine hydroxylase-related dioxygenase (phytanoyl-CoA dioxygenase family)